MFAYQDPFFLEITVAASAPSTYTLTSCEGNVTPDISGFVVLINSSPDVIAIPSNSADMLSITSVKFLPPYLPVRYELAMTEEDSSNLI